VRRPILSILLLALDCGPWAPPEESPADVAPAEPAAPAPEAPQSRIVVIGDLLGDRARSDRALSLAGVLSPDGRWNGGATTLVQLGDLIDPGPDTKAVVERWMALADEAAAAGGRVVVLLGEHEALDLLGEWKEISPADIASFGSAGARVEALSAREPIGTWLRSRDAVVEIERTLFVHGGIHEKWSQVDAAVLSSQVRAAIGQSGPDFVLGAEGPLRYRGFLRTNAVDVCGELEKVLAGQGADRLVVGHASPPSGMPESRCGGRGWWVGGSSEPGVLEIGPGGVRPIGAGAPVDPLPAP
jgi:hypothetical protein